MTWNVFCSKLDPVCLKLAYGIEEYDKVRAVCSLVNATALYTLYTTMVEEPMAYRNFYRCLKQYLYYDRYECVHGIEFMYYVKFKDIKVTSNVPKDVIQIRRIKDES